MTARWPRVAWLLLLFGLYAGRFFSCVSALNREVRPADQPYNSVDPHGFLLVGAFFAALILLLPTCWLLFGGWTGPGYSPAATRRRTQILRAAAVLAIIGTPTLPQAFYLGALPFAATWPIAMSSAAWFAAVAVAMLHQSPRLPSAQRAFSEHPVLAWGAVLVTGVPAVAMLVLSAVGP